MTRPTVLRTAVLICLTGLTAALAPEARAQQQQKRDAYATPPPALPDFDVREQPRGATAALSAERLAKTAAVARRLAATTDETGRPVRYSLGRNGWPKTISSAAGLTEPSNATPETIARRFLANETGISPYSPADLAGLRLRMRSSAGGLQIVHLRQFADGVPVYRSSVKIAVDAEGRIRAAAFSDPAPGVRLTQPLPSLSAAEAARLALRMAGVELDGPLAALPESNDRRLFTHPEPDQLPVAVELTAFPLPGGSARLAWRVFADAGRYSYETLLAADNGDLLFRANLVEEMGSGRIFPITPLEPSEIRDFGEGWLSEGSTVTAGNNIDAYSDIDGDDEPDELGAPGLQNGRASSADRRFDFDPGNGRNAGRATRAAAVTNAFYHANLAHNYFYELGFQEAEGNFQTDNFGRGGAGDDAVLVEVHDRDWRNNASFRLRPEGMQPRIQLGLWTLAEDEVRDFAFDGPTILHEYAHGVTSRAIGGPDDVTCLFTTQADALSEGWSDYFGASAYEITVPGDYITGDLENGIRRAAIDRNPRTFLDLGDPRFQEHADGEIWAATLWDIRTALGAETADRLIYQALLLTPCSPTYVEARDAILTVDGGEHETELWTAFAARGLGFGATASNSSTAVVTVFDANFDLPPDLAPGNRAPRITSVPRSPAIFGEPYSYTIRSLDVDGDSRSYELVSGPQGIQVDAATGELTWDSPLFTNHRIQIAVTDGNGGRTVHGVFLRVRANLTFGQPIQISGARSSFGFAYMNVPPETGLLQVRLRGENGDPDLVLFSPEFETERSFLFGANETLTIRDPMPGQWVARVDAPRAYDGVTLVAETLEPQELPLPGEAMELSSARSGERFFKVVVPEQTPLLRISLTGTGDGDLYLARGRVPVCGDFFTTLDCDADRASEDFGTYELLRLENPEPGDYFVSVYAFGPYAGATLKAGLSAPDIRPAATTDGARFTPMNAPGGIASLFGENLAETTEAAASLPLPLELGGVRVIVDGLEAALFFVSPGQINFQFPSEAFGGRATVYVVRGGEISDPVAAPFSFSAPQVFVDPNTMLPIVAHADGSLVTPENPARPGEAIVVYFTGIGFVSETPADGEPSPSGPLATTILEPRATLGEANLSVLFAGLSPGFVGLAQANIVLPDTLPEGPTLPLVLIFDTGFTTHESLPVELPVAP